MARHRVAVVGIEVIDAQPVAAMLPPRAVEIATPIQMQPHMGAALGSAEEDQVPRRQQLRLPGMHRHRVAEALLQVGIPGEPDAGAGKGGLHQPGTIEIGPQGAAPEITVRTVHPAQGQGQHLRQAGLDLIPLEPPGLGPRAGFGSCCQGAGLGPAGIAIVEQAHAHPAALALAQNLQGAAGGGLGGQAGSPATAVEVQRLAQSPGAAGDHV